MTSIWKTVLFCFSLLIVSCAKDTLPNNYPDTEPGIPVKVELSLRIPKFDTPQAAKSKSVSEALNNKLHFALISDSLDGSSGNEELLTRAVNAPLYNLWIFQFSENGTVRKVIRASTDDKPVYENQTIEVELMTGTNQTIYMLALGKRYGGIDLLNVGSLDELEATSFDFVRYENGLPTPVVKNAEDVPYGGSSSKLSIIQLEENGKGYVDYKNSGGFSGAITMKALVSLVTMDFSFQVENMTPFSISLNNVPTTFAVNSSTHKPSNFVNLPTTMLNSSDFNGTKRMTMSWYTAPNPQGIVTSITSEFDRYFYFNHNSPTPVGTAPRDGTYIHLWASDAKTTDNYALYYLFLGSNTVNDFNIHPHSHYRYRTDINTADDTNDKRIVYKTLKESVDFSVSANKSPRPELLRPSSSFDLDAHPDMRPIELTALRGSISVDILPANNGVATPWPATDATPIDELSSWLKLSIYPNYTAALTAHQNGDPNALTTSINLDASIPGLFRLYLYSDEYEKYISDNTRLAKYKRSLFVRFTFRTETSKSNVYLTRMDQVPAFYIGEFGGEPKFDNGVFRYPKGLAIETMNEEASIQYLSYMPKSIKLYGAYGTNISTTSPSDADMRRYDAYNVYNGRMATKMMAENTHGISPITTKETIQKPRYVNGHIDLYQYKHYTGDGFAQRWCYDKNRDNNRNGYLDDDEIVWYMPSIWQVFSLPLNCYNTETDYIRISNNVGFNAYRLHSTTMISNTSRSSFDFYNVFSYTANIADELLVRCVRDVELIAGGAQGVRYYVEENYPVIDATGLMEGASEDRVDNPNVVIRGRVIRHYLPNYVGTADGVVPIEQKISRRFRVALCDVTKDGQPVAAGNTARMTWAEASGYDTATNTLPIDGNITTTTQTGCAAYRGKDGTDDIGKWRLPTAREALTIAMMNPAMEADKAQTGYIPLSYIDEFGKGYGSSYWTAAEIDGSNNKACCMTASAKVQTSVGKGNENVWTLTDKIKGNEGSDATVYTRCIYDLH